MRLTSRGAGVLALALLCLGIGISVPLPELLALTAGLIALLAMGLLSVALSTRVEVTPPRAVRVPRASESTLDITLLDHGARPLSGMRLRRIGGAGPGVVGLPRLRPGIPSVAGVPIPTAMRGPVVMGPWIVERVDTWLLARRVVTAVSAVEVVVVPRVYDIAVGQLTSRDGDRSSRADEGHAEVATLREYVPGDEPRHIHWRSSARAGALMVTQRVDAHRPGVRVVLDVSRGSYTSEDEFEEAVDAAASIAISTALTGVPVWVSTTAGESARAGGGRHAGVLDLLARVQMQDGPGELEPSREASVLVSGARCVRRGSATVVLGLAAPAGGSRAAGRLPSVVRARTAAELAQILGGP